VPKGPIHVLPIPTPFAVGRVNLYLIEDDPLTLVDAGPNSGKALDELERALAVHGRRIEDLELIVLTHQHIDHVGLASILARRSGAEVAALGALAPYLENFSEEAELDDAFAETMMLRHGITADVGSALRAVSRAFRGWGGAARVTQPLVDGGTLELAHRSFRVLHRPGHSPSDTIFWDEASGELVGGDHLLGHISSNPLLTRPLPGSPAPADGRPKALVEYIASLRQTRALPLDLVHPGHGDPVTDHVALIDERLRLHDRRARRILRMIEEEPRTAHEIAHAMWGQIALTQAYLTLSEVLGHVDLLLEDGRVREEDEDGVIRLVAA
jgi:glyoxylase-like metal-dependent hydrolase (beta-lactamase superfamily II)